MLTRRFFLKSSGLALVGSAAAPSFLHRAAALDSSRKKVLVALFQRGAVDGLNMVAPYFEERYYKARPSLALPRPGRGDDALLDLDGRFGFHPALEALMPFWNGHSLAVIHACGSPDATRSHFDAQDYMESATPGDKGARDGWLNRYLALKQSEDSTPLRSVAWGEKLPRALQGAASAVAIGRLREFQLARGNPAVNRAFRNLYAPAAAQDELTEKIAGTSRDTFAALQIVEQVRAKPYTPANGARYPRGRLGEALQQLAQLIKAGVGVEIAFADSGGWDTHTNQAPQINLLLRGFGEAIAAFATDLGSRMNDVVLLTMSEFGRTVKENGNRGTDHGHANAMLALGGGVAGGEIYGEWPGLDPDQLFEGRDLALTTDFRDVFAEALRRHMGAENVDPVFPGYGADPKRFRGFLKA